VNFNVNFNVPLSKCIVHVLVKRRKTLIMLVRILRIKYFINTKIDFVGYFYIFVSD
jgi:hypothetical protein